VYIVGPAVNYAVNRMPHRPEIGRKQNETVSGESYATMQRYLDCPYVCRVWHDRMQTAKSSVRDVTARYQEQSSTTTATAMPSSRSARSVAVPSSEYTKSKRCLNRRTGRSSARSAGHFSLPTPTTSIETRQPQTDSRPLAKSVARGWTTVSTVQTESVRRRTAGTSPMGCGVDARAGRPADHINEATQAFRPVRLEGTMVPTTAVRGGGTTQIVVVGGRAWR